MILDRLVFAVAILSLRLAQLAYSRFGLSRTIIFVSHAEALLILDAFHKYSQRPGDAEQCLAIQLIAACTRLKSRQRNRPQLRRVK